MSPPHRRRAFGLGAGSRLTHPRHDCKVVAETTGRKKIMAENGPDCLMCAVRQLTEGSPEFWNPEREGENVAGVVLRAGEHATPFGGMVPFVDLWLGGMDRVRVIAYPAHLAGQLTNQKPQVGDRVSIGYEGRKRIERGRHSGQDYKVFQVTVERGHH